MTEYIQVMTTVETEKDAQKIAELVVEKRLAGCVQITGPMTSVYQWQGKIEKAGEYLLLIKSRRDLFSALEREISTNHPYEVPEILALPIVDGAKSYLDWLSGELSSS